MNTEKPIRKVDPETLFEMRAAFGSDGETVNALNGERTDLRTGNVYAPRPTEVRAIADADREDHYRVEIDGRLVAYLTAKLVRRIYGDRKITWE